MAKHFTPKAIADAAWTLEILERLEGNIAKSAEFNGELLQAKVRKDSTELVVEAAHEALTAWPEGPVAMEASRILRDYAA